MPSVNLNDDEDALSELPTFNSIYPDYFSQEYIYGPQGHPASMRMSVSAFEEHDYKFSVCRFGPLITGGQFHVSYLFGKEALVYLRTCIEYGRKIEKHFGSDPYWHRCKKGCFGVIYNYPITGVHLNPPYKNCQDCLNKRTRAEADTEHWLTSHPVPMPEQP